MKDLAITIDNLSKIYLIKNNLNKSGNTVRNDSKTQFYALQNICLKINKGDTVGIIGKNGAGKSTLLKILSKITKPTEGKVKINGKVTSLLEVGTGFHSELTGRENLFINGAIFGLNKNEIKKRLDDIVIFSEIGEYLDRPVKQYSSGMYLRLAFSVSIFLNTDILILDEILAVGDILFQKKCFDKINEFKNSDKTVILVSHNIDQILRYTNKCIYLEEGKLKSYGPTELIINEYLDQSLKKDFGTFIKNAKCEYSEETLTVFVEYEIPVSSFIPNLGLVIYDKKYTPITGSNLIFENGLTKNKFERNGIMSCQLNNISLQNGTYYISLWISDEFENLENHEFCLSFHVTTNINMIPNTGSIRVPIKFKNV